MRSIIRHQLGHDLIDFESWEPCGGFSFSDHLRAGPVTLTHGTSRPIEGKSLAAAQVIVAIHEGKAF